MCITFLTVKSAIKCRSNKCSLIKVDVVLNLKPNVKAKCSVLEGQALEHALTLGKIEVLSARYRSQNARA